MDHRLRATIDQNRGELYHPWRELVASSPGLQSEMDRTVQLLQVFFNKWVVEILIVLGQHGTMRFSELKASLDGISGRTLSQRLRDLEDQGLVHRRLHDEMPVRVDYTLTDKGLDIVMLALPLVLYLRLKSELPATES
ncbi:MAG TPA: helix-turn-helix domain-containing protein [Candidatus Thermoplasmatota archaeon]|nr:helix-turn-helix domain-containing protein [Candidatus Thermoplasmatota archaeon]